MREKLGRVSRTHSQEAKSQTYVRELIDRLEKLDDPDRQQTVFKALSYVS